MDRAGRSPLRQPVAVSNWPVLGKTGPTRGAGRLGAGRAVNMALAAARRDAWKHVSLDTLLEQASRPTWHLAAEARRWLKDGLLLDEGGRLVLPDLEGIRALVERQEE